MPARWWIHVSSLDSARYSVLDSPRSMSQTSPTSTSARSPAPSSASSWSASARELVAREHVELGLGLGGEQLRDHPRRGERGEPGDERGLARPRRRAGAASRRRAGARIGPCFASISAIISSTWCARWSRWPSFVITQVATASLSASGACAAIRARASPRRDAVARDEPLLLDLGAAPRRRSARRARACARFSTSNAAS